MEEVACWNDTTINDYLRLAAAAAAAWHLSAGCESGMKEVACLNDMVGAQICGE
jgi:hypothetical protein